MRRKPPKGATHWQWFGGFYVRIEDCKFYMQDENLEWKETPSLKGYAHLLRSLP